MEPHSEAMVTPLPEMLTSGGLLTVATHSLTAPLAREGPLPKGSGSRGIGYLSWKYAILKAGRTSCQGAATTANYGGSIDN